eukprot:sb/3473984/
MLSQCTGSAVECFVVKRARSSGREEERGLFFYLSLEKMRYVLVPINRIYKIVTDSLGQTLIESGCPNNEYKYFIYHQIIPYSNTQYIQSFYWLILTVNHVPQSATSTSTNMPKGCLAESVSILAARQCAQIGSALPDSQILLQ